MTPSASGGELIQAGAALMALRMEGHPPADTVDATAKVWMQALWPGRMWDERLDAERIGEAFRQIALHETRWPTPAVFLRHLPARAPQKSLPPPRHDAAERERARDAQIRAAYDAGERVQDIARRFRLSERRVWAILGWPEPQEDEQGELF